MHLMRKNTIRPLPLALMALGLLAALLLMPWGARGDGMVDKPARPDTMPRFLNGTQGAWINSKPLQPDDLRGQVVLVEVWTSV